LYKPFLYSGSLLLCVRNNKLISLLIYVDVNWNLRYWFEQWSVTMQFV